MKKICLLLVFVFIIVTSSFGAQPFIYQTISIEEISGSLPEKPVTIGLDVDDTALFSTPGFHYAFNNNDGPDGSNKYGEKPLKSDMFWQDMSGEFDKFSLPKESARNLIDMHKKRGDRVIFITARPKVKTEFLSKILRKTFDLPANSLTIFSGNITKAEYIKKYNISIFYGDSDSDITEANDAGIRAIRFLRSPMSSNKGKYHPGQYGEAVLENSEN